MRLEQGRVDGQFVLADDLALHADVGRSTASDAQRRVQRGDLRRPRDRSRQHAAMRALQFVAQPGRDRLAHLVRAARAAQTMTSAPSMSSASACGQRRVAEAARGVVGARAVHLDQHQRERLGQVEPVLLGTVGEHRRVVLTRRDERAQQHRRAAIACRLGAVLRQQDDADDAAAALEGAHRDVFELAAMEEQAVPRTSSPPMTGSARQVSPSAS